MRPLQAHGRRQDDDRVHALRRDDLRELRQERRGLRIQPRNPLESTHIKSAFPDPPGRALYCGIQTPLRGFWMRKEGSACALNSAGFPGGALTLGNVSATSVRTGYGNGVPDDKSPGTMEALYEEVTGHWKSVLLEDPGETLHFLCSVISCISGGQWIRSGTLLEPRPPDTTSTAPASRFRPRTAKKRWRRRTRSYPKL